MAMTIKVPDSEHGEHGGGRFVDAMSTTGATHIPGECELAASHQLLAAAADGPAETGCLGFGAFLGVPASDRTESDVYRSYASLIVGPPRALCATDDVVPIASRCRARPARRAKKGTGRYE